MRFDCVHGFLNSIKEIIWQTEAIYRYPLMTVLTLLQDIALFAISHRSPSQVYATFPYDYMLTYFRRPRSEAMMNFRHSDLSCMRLSSS